MQMNNYNSIKYKHNFLNQVILRLDFLQFLETEKLFSDDTEKFILKRFPRRGIDQKVRFNTINVVINPNTSNTDKTTKKSLEGIQREYYAGKNKILLSNKFIIYEINEYNTFENLYDNFQSIIIALYTKQNITSARTGIRYINIFDSRNIKLRKNMFSPLISAIFNAKEFVSEDNLKLTRAMSINEYQVENMILNFRFGMFNPDYPSILNKNSFSLDYDCFTTEPLESTEEILMSIKKGHDAIQKLFESSITDYLRKVLKNE